MHTEEDTFLALKRTPFWKVYLHVTTNVRAGETIGYAHRDYLRAEGWGLIEFQNIVNTTDGLLSINNIRNEDWRQRYAEVRGQVELM